MASHDAIDRTALGSRHHSDRRRDLMTHSTGNIGFGECVTENDQATDDACDRMHKRRGIPFVWVWEKKDRIVYVGGAT